MSGTVIGKTLGLGYAGKVSRNPMNKINSRFVKSILDGSGVETQDSIPFGFAVVTNTDNTYSKFGESGSGVSAATAANFGGVAIAEVKQSLTYGYGSNASGGQYEPTTTCDVIQQGSVTVFCKEGTPTAGGKVYIVTVAGDTTGLGEFCATSTPAGSGATAVELTNCHWTTGRQDADGICEMTLMTQSNA